MVLADFLFKEETINEDDMKAEKLRTELLRKLRYPLSVDIGEITRIANDYNKVANQYNKIDVDKLYNQILSLRGL
jgi:hypothetical protein